MNELAIPQSIVVGIDGSNPAIRQAVKAIEA
jgi:hypothetical protein